VLFLRSYDIRACAPVPRESGKVTALVLLNLSAALNTVDLETPLFILNSCRYYSKRAVMV